MNLFYELVVDSSLNQKNWKLKRTTIYVALITYSYSVYIHHTHHEGKSYRVQVQFILTSFTRRQNLKHYIKHLLDIANRKKIYILIINLNPST
jgi:thiaminase